MVYMETTTILLKRTTKSRLDDIEKKPDSYDDILVRLIDFYEKFSLKWSINN